MQPTGTLRGLAKHDYLLQPLQEGKEITMNIQLPNGRGKDEKMAKRLQIRWYILNIKFL